MIRFMVKLTASLQVWLQRTPSFSLSISSEFAVSDEQYYYRTFLLNIFMTLYSLTSLSNRFTRKPLSRIEPSDTRRYAYLNKLCNHLSNGVMFNIVALTNYVTGVSIESMPSRHKRYRARDKLVFSLGFSFPIVVYNFF